MEMSRATLKWNRKQMLVPVVETFPKPSTGLAHPISRNGRVSMSMTSVDNVILLPSAIILHYSELAGLPSGTILIPFTS